MLLTLKVVRRDLKNYLRYFVTETLCIHVKLVYPICVFARTLGDAVRAERHRQGLVEDIRVESPFDVRIRICQEIATFSKREKSDKDAKEKVT